MSWADYKDRMAPWSVIRSYNHPRRPGFATCENCPLHRDERPTPTVEECHQAGMCHRAVRMEDFYAGALGLPWEGSGHE